VQQEEGKDRRENFKELQVLSEEKWNKTIIRVKVLVKRTIFFRMAKSRLNNKKIQK
jgi:hypothetical protein